MAGGIVIRGGRRRYFPRDKEPGRRRLSQWMRGTMEALHSTGTVSFKQQIVDQHGRGGGDQ
jgi:hypothetical protein